MPGKSKWHVKDLSPITGDAALKRKLAAGISPALVVPEAAAAMPAQKVVKPGTERWPVKTGSDADVGEVGANEQAKGALDFGFIGTTVEELRSIPRPSEADTRTSEDHRVSEVETTVWQIEAEIITLKQEADGDYHLVFQGDSGDTMIGEVPTPRPPFVKKDSPFLGDITTARKWVDKNLLSGAPDFTAIGATLAPAGAIKMAPHGAAVAAAKVAIPNKADGNQFTFKTKIRATKARITGVGFFDRLHGQTGVAPNGIELHPVLNIEFVK